MARFGQVEAQYFDDAGDPLSSGTITFYETGTTTLKTTYADINYTVPNTNPVVLSAAGRQPAIFFDGVARAILATSGGTQVVVSDPVGETSTNFGDAWIATKIYGADSVVIGSDGVYYRSLTAGNQNNNPTSTSGYWTLLYSIEYAVGITYAEGANVTYLGILYQSLQSSNLNNTPSSASAYWVPINLAWRDSVTYADNQNVVGSDGIFYTSLQASNLNKEPSANPLWWVGTSAAAATSATAAATSATAAATSATASATSATAAATSATNAATSATAAATSATASATSATNAATSATNAATSATASATSATAAAASATAAANTYDDFDDRYLGQKSSDPTVDNDGDALVTGALYFNTTSNAMKVYNGSTWSAVAPTATSVTLSQISDLNANLDSFLTTPSSANLITAVTDETGTGSLVFSTSPTLITPVLGTPASGTATNLTGLPPAGVTGTAAILGANTFTALQTEAAGADIASATAVDLTAATGNVVVITGTTESTSLTMTAGQQMVLIAAAAWPLTFHATTMNITGGVSYTCAAGDRLYVTKDVDNVIRVSVIKQDGTAVVPGAASSVAVGDITGAGTGVLTALAVNVGSAGAPVVLGGALGTPSGGTLTNATGLPISTGVSGLATNVATFLGTSSSANLASAVTDETGSGSLVFGTSPTLVTPALGTPASGVLTNATGLPISTGVSGLATNVATFLGTSSSANLASAVTDETGSGALVFGTSPTLVTPALGTPSAAVLTSATGLPLTTGVTGTLPIANGGTNSTSTAYCSLTANVSGTLPVANGGTGATSLTANNVVLGNGTSAVQVVAPSTSGNVLTSNGSTWASTAPAPSGGVREFTASGTIGDGVIVTLQSDGTVQVVVSSAGDAEAGTPVVFESAVTTTYVACACFDSNSNKIVIAYQDGGNSYYGTAVVGTVTASDNSISFGTPVVYSTAGTINYSSAAFDPDTNQVVICYRVWNYPSIPGYAHAIVGAVSGTSMSFGTAVVWNSGDTYDIGNCYDTAANRVVITYTPYAEPTPNSYGTAIIGTVSGTAISFGTPVVFEPNFLGYGNKVNCVFDSNSDKVVVVYRDESNSNYGTGIVGTVSGTSISFGTNAVFETSAIMYPSASFDSTANKVVCAYEDVGNSSYGTAVVGTVSGTSISFGTPAVFESAAVEYTHPVYQLGANKTAILYQDEGNSDHGTLLFGTISGTDITFGTAIEFESAETEFIGGAYDSSADRVVVAYRDGGNSDYGTACVVNQAVISDVNDEVGIAAEAGTDGNPIDITIIGGINASQSGLTIGAGYWAGSDGTLSSSDSGYQKMGIAVSATELLIRGY